MALELLGSEQAKAVYVCVAPLVEGSIAASVAAAAGMPIEQVSHEAHRALAAKYRQPNQTMPLPAEKPSAASLVAAPLSTDTRKAVFPQPGEQLQFSWQIQNPHGIHLRSAAAIVTAVSPFDADVWLSKGGQKINAKSINKITLLGLKHHDTVIASPAGKKRGKPSMHFARWPCGISEKIFPAKTLSEKVCPEKTRFGKLNLLNYWPVRGGVLGNLKIIRHCHSGFSLGLAR